MSDRIAIFNGGQIEQVGNGEDLYDRPESLFVADFIGESNILRGRFERDPDGGWLVRNDARWRVSTRQAERRSIVDKAPAALVVRPERLRFAADDGPLADGLNAVAARVTEVLYLGSSRKVELALADDQAAVVRQPIDMATEDVRPGQAVRLTWRADDAVLVAAPSES